MKKIGLLSSAAIAALLINATTISAQQREPGSAAQQQAPQRGENATERGAPSARPDRAQAPDDQSRQNRGAQSSQDPKPSAQKSDGSSKSRSAADEDKGPKGGDQKRQERRARDDDSEGKRKQDRARGQKQDSESGRSREDASQNQRQERRAKGRDRDEDRGRDRQRDRAGSDKDRSPATQESRSKKTDVTISERDRSRVSASFSTTVDRLNVEPVSRTRVSVSIGARVPADVRVYDVPTDVVTLYPRFRGHKFVVVDEEIVILHPQRREIVATLPRRGDRQAGSVTTGMRSGSIGLSKERRVEIREVLMERPVCRYEQRLDFSIGIPLPKSVQICEFPEELVTDIPEIRSYRYVVRDDRVLIVDPDEYRVVDIIE